ncbi:MAG TPA: hypothetical protein VFG18_02100 [Xanthomonadaceae bacterium]|jgi:hypothetical protein|nr:hypothetical protein [Xanthomonadaceae bacterium]
MNRRAIALPILPAEEIRAAAATGDWVRATELVRGHDHAVRAAWIDPPAEEQLPAWRDLLAEQQQLMLELQQRRDEAADAIARLQREGRAAHRYLSQAADTGE